MFYLLVFLMVATVSVLIIGVISMAMPSKISEKSRNRLMTARVVLQGLALVTLGIMFIIK